MKDKKVWLNFLGQKGGGDQIRTGGASVGLANPCRPKNIASEVLPIAEEQLEQDVLPHQDDKTPVSSFEDDDTEELDKGHICWRYEIGHKLGEGGFGFVHAGARCKDGLKVYFNFTYPSFYLQNFAYLFRIHNWSDISSMHVLIVISLLC